MGWLERKIERVVRRLAGAGEILIAAAPSPVDCAACGGAGRRGHYGQFEFEGGSAKTLRLAIKASQGICMSCEGAGVVIPRKAGSQ